MTPLLFNLERTQPSGNSLRHGGGIYGEIVFRRIVERGLPMQAVYDSSRWFNPEIRQLCKEKGITLVDMAGRNMQQVVDEVKPVTFYTPLPQKGLGTLKGTEVVCTIHGLRDLELPNDRFAFRYKTSLRNLVREIVSQTFRRRFQLHRKKIFDEIIMNPTARFITVSNHSLSSLHLFYPEIRKKKIEVFYSPSTCTDYEPERTRHEKYFLMVSGDRWPKNNLRAIIALDELFGEGLLPEHKVIVTGAKSADVFRYRIRHPEKFEFVGYVDDSELARLHHDAFCFLYPTLNEGFGYPPLEAMRYGVPVLSSPFTSVAEVCGDAAVYFNPYDINEIKMRILRILNPDFHAEMSARGTERYSVIRKKQDDDLDRMIDFIYASSAKASSDLSH